MRLLASIVALLIAAASVPAQAAGAGAGAEEDCNQLGSNVAIVDCQAAATKRWDQRLNAAYKALQQRADPAQREPLKDAQRLWIRWRDANCGFYAAGEGSISRVLSADCRRTMTRERACELEAAGNFESGAGPGCK